MRFITILTIFACVFTLIFQACTGNLTQQYNDIIIEWSAWAFSNKSSEMLLLYLLAFGGITFLSLDFFFSKKNSKNTITFDVKNILLPLIFFYVLYSVCFSWKNKYFIIIGISSFGIVLF